MIKYNNTQVKSNLGETNMPTKSPWQTITIPAGQSEVEVDVPFDNISVPPGKVRKADGSKYSGHDRPRFDLDESGTKTKIVLHVPASEDVKFQYKNEEEETPETT